nr:MAG: hypothetical protein [Microvirus Sku211]
MSVKDVYAPSYSSTNFGDQMSDAWLGTNKVSQKDMLNSLEQQKATALNKYEWNKQGMLSAGINPLMNPSGLNSADASPSSPSPRGTKLGKAMERVLDKTFKIVEEKVKDKDDAIKVIAQLL